MGQRRRRSDRAFVVSANRDSLPGMNFNDDDLRQRLTPEQYHVTQEAGTEAPFSGVYWDAKDDGTYHCIVCDSPLFSSVTKYDSGTGWPSFWEPIAEGAVATERDGSLFMERREMSSGTRFPKSPASKIKCTCQRI